MYVCMYVCVAYCVIISKCVCFLSDRAVGNTLEQMVPFLLGLWVYAVFVSPERAAELGWIYVGCRAFYPALFHFGPWRVLSTTPCYIIIGMFWIGVFREAIA